MVPQTTIAAVDVQGLRTVNPEAVRAELNVPTDRPVSNEEIAQAAQRVFATTDFETVNYSLVDTDGRRQLIITPYEKSWGYNSLRLGGSIQTDFDSINTFDLLAAHTWRWLNSYGAEWRNEAQIGDTQRLLTEWYQPLAPGSRWFVMPRLRLERVTSDVFFDEARISRLRNTVRSADVQFGRALPGLGSVRVGVGRYYFHTETQVGIPLFNDQKANANGVSFGFNVDTLDTVNYPRKGYLANAQFVYLGDIEGDRLRNQLSRVRVPRPDHVRSLHGLRERARRRLDAVRRVPARRPVQPVGHAGRASVRLALRPAAPARLPQHLGCVRRPAHADLRGLLARGRRCGRTRHHPRLEPRAEGRFAVHRQ